MPLKIIKTPNDPFNSRKVVYVPDPYDLRHEQRPRPQGSMHKDPVSGHWRVRQNVKPDRELFVGLDLGQSLDFSALVVVERYGTGLAVRFIARTRGMNYPDVVSATCDLMSRPELAGARLIIDATGVGRPVLDLLRASGLDPIAVTITGAAKVTGGRKNIRVPKRNLMHAALLALQAGILSIPPGIDHADALRNELADMRAKITAAGHDTYEARSGAHDDLVLALALAVWASEQRRLG